jgi:hypothetical protein
MLICSASFVASARPNPQFCNPYTPQQLSRSQAFLQNTPCAGISTACVQAQYILGCYKVGKGLEANCIQPLLKGTAVNGVSIAPTDPQVAACKTYCSQNRMACAPQKGVADR